MPSDPLVIYGASGYTGRLIVEQAVARGLRPILGGRSAAPLRSLASRYRLESRVATLDDPSSLANLLEDAVVVIHAAGPFSSTAMPMMRACLRAGVHYLDITGECVAFEALALRSRESQARRCMVMPGCGFDVVASDCLARHVAGRLQGACRLAIGISGLAPPSRGSMRTMIEQAGRDVRVRRGGRLASAPVMSLRRRFAYGNGDGWSGAVTWGDVVTAFHSTGIPDIEVYFEETPAVQGMLAAGRRFGPVLQLPLAQAWLKAQADVLPEGPAAIDRAGHGCVIVAEVEARDGRTAATRLATPSAYTFTAAASSAIAARVLDGDVEFGFQTPSRVYGADFVLRLPGVIRHDLDSVNGATVDRAFEQRVARG